MSEEKSVQKFQETTMEVVLKKVTEFRECGGLHLPADYSVENAMRGAWLVLQDLKDKSNMPVLQTCSRESIANALLDMATQGLSVAKKQGAFVQYGNKITFQREYFGNIALAKRYSGMKDVHGNIIYKDDVFKYGVNAETGRKYIIQHTQEVSNIDFTKIVGAYALVMMEDGSTFLEVMSWPQIQQSWKQGSTKGESPAHKNFPDQMAIKTVVNRALKILISSSNDAVLMENIETNRPIEAVKEEIKQGANSGKVIDIPVEDEEIQTPEVVEEPVVESTVKPGKGKDLKKEEPKEPGF